MARHQHLARASGLAASGSHDAQPLVPQDASHPHRARHLRLRGWGSPSAAPRERPRHRRAAASVRIRSASSSRMPAQHQADTPPASTARWPASRLRRAVGRNAEASAPGLRGGGDLPNPSPVCSGPSAEHAAAESTMMYPQPLPPLTSVQVSSCRFTPSVQRTVVDYASSCPGSPRAQPISPRELNPSMQAPPASADVRRPSFPLHRPELLPRFFFLINLKKTCVFLRTEVRASPARQ